MPHELSHGLVRQFKLAYHALAVSRHVGCVGACKKIPSPSCVTTSIGNPQGSLPPPSRGSNGCGEVCHVTRDVTEDLIEGLALCGLQVVGFLRQKGLLHVKGHRVLDLARPHPARAATEAPSKP